MLGPTVGSTALTTWTRTSLGSGPSGGQERQRGSPVRSRAATLRSFPQAAHASGLGPQTPQYQSSPRRWKLRSCLSQLAHLGGEMPGAPVSDRATSKSPTTRGAGERPSMSSDGRSSNACAKRRRVDLRGAMRSTTSSTAQLSSAGPVWQTRRTITPRGPRALRAKRLPPTSRHELCEPFWGAGRRSCHRLRRLWLSWPGRPRPPVRSAPPCCSTKCPTKP